MDSNPPPDPHDPRAPAPPLVSRADSYRPQRPRWVGFVGAATIVAAVAALMVWSHDGGKATKPAPESGTTSSQQAPAEPDPVRESAVVEAASAAPVKQ